MTVDEQNKVAIMAFKSVYKFAKEQERIIEEHRRRVYVDNNGGVYLFSKTELDKMDGELKAYSLLRTCLGALIEHQKTLGPGRIAEQTFYCHPPFGTRPL